MKVGKFAQDKMNRVLMGWGSICWCRLSLRFGLWLRYSKKERLGTDIQMERARVSWDPRVSTRLYR